MIFTGRLRSFPRWRYFVAVGIAILVLLWSTILYAATVTISDGNGNCDQSDTDVTVSASDTYVIDCSGADGWHVNSLVIEGVVTHAAADLPGVVITSDGGITINGSIDVMGKGYAGGRGLNNADSAEDGYTCDGCDGGGKKSKMSDVATEHYGSGGGGHGGVGGMAARSAVGYGVGGGSYDSAMNPTMFGSGGGGGTSYGDNTLYDGGAGGGLVKLTAQTVTIEGAITANGADGEGRTDGTCSTARIQGGGGGAGGTIVINTDTLECGDSCGAITATGGTRGDHCTDYYDIYCCASEDASGGGGRVAIRFQSASTDDLTGLIENLYAYGLYTNKRGESGTAILINTSTKDAYIRHGFDFQAADLFDDDAEDGYKDFKFDANNNYRNLYVYMAALRLHTSIKIELDGDFLLSGFDGQRNGAFYSLNNYSYLGCKDPTYDMVLNANNLTVANDAFFRIYYPYPRAGADNALFPNQNYLCNNTSVTFTESANLTSGYFQCGGSMSVDVSANTEAVNHTIFKIYAEDGIALQLGQDDTIGAESVLSVSENGDAWVNISGTIVTLDDVDIIGNANIDVATFVMDADSTISASGKGYDGGDLDVDGADGYGFCCDGCDGGGAPAYIDAPDSADDAYGAGGGGHGGVGGDADYNDGTIGMGGDTYDSTNSPQYFGAGGGSGYRESTAYGATRHAYGGAGGGAVIIEADFMTLAGTISADGDQGQSGLDGVEGQTNVTAYGGGGGAGGTIHLKGGTVECDGAGCPILSVAGGAGGEDYRQMYDTHIEPPGGSGGGGGGIIRVDYSSLSGANQTSMQSAALIAGGAGHEDAGAGGVGVISFEQTNEAPIADAGGPYAQQQPGAISILDGSNSSDGDSDPITYAWTCTSCPQEGSDGFVNCNTSISLLNTTTATPSFTVYDHGNYVFELTVDDTKTTVTDTATISVANVIPAVTSTVASSTVPGVTVDLTATITDANNDAFGCVWRVQSAPYRRYLEDGVVYLYDSPVFNAEHVIASVCSSSIDIPTHLAADDVFLLQLVVTDEHGAQNFVDVPITIGNTDPIVSESDTDREDYVSGTVSVSGSDDNLDELTYTFAKKEGAGVAPDGAVWSIDSATGAFHGNRVGTYHIIAEICDEQDACVEEEIEFDVQNAPPVVVLPQTERVVSRTELDGNQIGELFSREITDLNDDEDFVVTPLQNSGPSDLVFDGDSIDTSRAYKKGVYTGRYLVTDGTDYDNNSSYSEEWSITLPNNAPSVVEESAEGLAISGGRYEAPAFQQSLLFEVTPFDLDGDNIAARWRIYDVFGEEVNAGFTQTDTDQALMAFQKPGTYAVSYQIDDGDGGVTTEDRTFYIPLPELTEAQAAIDVVTKEEDVDEIGLLQIRFRAPVWAWAKVNGVMAQDCTLYDDSPVGMSSVKAAAEEEYEFFDYVATFRSVPYAAASGDLSLAILTDLDGEYVSLVSASLAESGSATDGETESGTETGDDGDPLSVGGGDMYSVLGGGGCSLAAPMQLKSTILGFLMFCVPLATVLFKRRRTPH